MSNRAWIWIVAGACAGGASRPATPRAPTCDDAAAGLARSGTANRERHAAARSEQASGDDLARFESRYRQVTALVCERDGWSAEVIACFATAPAEAVASPGEGTVNTCANQLTCEQQHAFVATFRPLGTYPGPDCR